MSVQIIEKDGKPEYAVVPIDEFRRLQEQAELVDDIRAYDKAVGDIERGEDEIVPADVADQLLSGESPIRVWRKHRRLSQAELGRRADISQAYVVALEKGDRTGTVEVLHKVANELGVDLDDLVD